MVESSVTTMFTFNASFLDQTSLTGDNNHMTSAISFLHHDVIRMLWLIVPTVLLVLGCYGNVMTILVMRSMQVSESTGSLSVYFTALAVSDLSFLCINTLWYQPKMVLDSLLPYVHDLLCTVPFFVSYVSSLASAWFLVAMTCQRMTSVVLPHRVEVLCTVRIGKIITAIVTMTSCLANVYIFFYYHVEDMEGEYQSCISSDKHAVHIFGFLNLGLSSVVPFLLLIAANSVLIYGVVRSVKMSGKMAGLGHSHTPSRLAKASSMTITLILTSAAFLLLTLPTCIMWIYFETVGYYEGDIVDEALREQLALLETVCVLVWLSNSSINFYIYILSGKKFRQEAKRYLCSCSKQQQRSKLKVSG